MTPRNQETAETCGAERLDHKRGWNKKRVKNLAWDLHTYLLAPSQQWGLSFLTPLFQLKWQLQEQFAWNNSYYITFCYRTHVLLLLYQNQTSLQGFTPLPRRLVTLLCRSEVALHYFTHGLSKHEERVPPGPGTALGTGGAAMNVTKWTKLPAPWGLHPSGILYPVLIVYVVFQRFTLTAMFSKSVTSAWYLLHDMKSSRVKSQAP